MGLLDFFRKNPGNGKPEATNASLRKQLTELVLDFLREPDGRIRVEHAISASATIVAERCIDATGDYPLREHELTPGSRVFSTKANEWICGDVAEGGVSQAPKSSILGMLRARTDPKLYTDANFPSLPEVFRQYAARAGDAADWGKVPLSVSETNLPYIPPLRAGFETRDRVDGILEPIRDDKGRCLSVATESLAEILNMVASAIDRKVALRIAIETINGMAKTAAMTVKAMQQAQRAREEKQP